MARRPWGSWSRLGSVGRIDLSEVLDDHADDGPETGTEGTDRSGLAQTVRSRQEGSATERHERNERFLAQLEEEVLQLAPSFTC